MLGLIVLWGASQLVTATSNTLSLDGERRSLVRAMVRIVSQRAEGEAIWVASTSVNPAFPVVNLTGARWASRFVAVWLAAGVYTPEEKAQRPFPYHDFETLSEIERLQFDAVIDDHGGLP